MRLQDRKKIQLNVQVGFRFQVIFISFLNCFKKLKVFSIFPYKFADRLSCLSSNIRKTPHNSYTKGLAVYEKSSKLIECSSLFQVLLFFH